MQAFNGYESEDHQTYKGFNLQRRSDGYVYYSHKGGYSGKNIGDPIGRAWASFKSAKKCIDIYIKKAKA